MLAFGIVVEGKGAALGRRRFYVGRAAPRGAETGHRMWRNRTSCCNSAGVCDEVVADEQVERDGLAQYLGLRREM